MNDYTMIEADQLRTVITALKPWAPRKNDLGRAYLKCHVVSTGHAITFTVDDMAHRLSATVPTVDGVQFTALTSLEDVRKLLGKRKGGVQFTATDSALTMSIGSRTAKLANVIPAEDFPAPHFSDDNAKAMYSRSWPAIAETLPAASGDHSRPILTGAYFTHDGEVVATDSCRLYVTRDAIDPFEPRVGEDSHGAKGHLVDAERLARFIKLCGLNLAQEWAICSNGRARLKGGHAKLSEITFTADIKTIEGHFPNYRGLLPDDVTAQGQSFKVTADLIESVTEAVALAKQSAVPIRLTPVDGASLDAILTIQDKFTSEDRIVTPNSLAQTVAFNPEYFRDALTLDAEVYGRDELKPWTQVDTLDGCERLRLLMPVRVN